MKRATKIYTIMLILGLIMSFGSVAFMNYDCRIALSIMITGMVLFGYALYKVLDIT